MPMPKIRQGIKAVVKALSKQGGENAAKAILTTDTRKKEIVVKVGKVTVAGIAKGSGMIEPNMCTMHAFITTDAAIDRATLQLMLKQAVANSFNVITVPVMLQMFILSFGGAVNGPVYAVAGGF